MSEARDNLTRRSFLSASAASLGAALPAPGGAEQIQMPWSGPAVVRRVFLARHAGWPRPDVDLKAEVAKIEANLLEWQKRYPGRIQLTGGEMLRNEAAAEAWAAQATQADIILAFNLTTGVYSMLRKLVASDLPVVLFSLPYMGHDWTHAAAFQQMGNKPLREAVSNRAPPPPQQGAAGSPAGPQAGNQRLRPAVRYPVRFPGLHGHPGRLPGGGRLRGGERGAGVREGGVARGGAEAGGD